MVRLQNYTSNYEYFEIGDSFSNNDNVIYILDIFNLYGDTYVSYSFKSEVNLYTDKISTFLTLKSNYPTKIINSITLDKNSPCGCDKIENNE